VRRAARPAARSSCRIEPRPNLSPDSTAFHRIADSSSINAVSLSSARTTKRFPLSRCASVIQIVRPQESTAETQPQVQSTLGIVDYLRRKFAQLKLCAHFCKPAVSAAICSRKLRNQRRIHYSNVALKEVTSPLLLVRKIREPSGESKSKRVFVEGV